MMASKPVSADKILSDLRHKVVTKCMPIVINGGGHEKAARLSDSLEAEAKRQLAEAMLAIIGDDTKLTKTDDVTIEAHKNWLRAEQRKRLAEWLGEK